MVGRPRSNELFTTTELTGGRPRSLMAAEYEEKKRIKEEEEARIQQLAKRYGIAFEDDMVVKSDDIKEFTPEHKIVLAMFMGGKKQVDIARELGRSYVFVRKVLTSQKGKEVIAQWKSSVELELDGLLPKAIDAIRKGLDSSDRKINLLAVDRFIKMTQESHPGGVTINLVDNARNRFIGGLKGLVREEVEDVEYEEIA